MIRIAIMSAALMLAALCSGAAAAQPAKTGVGLQEVIAAVERPFMFTRNDGPEIVDVQADFFQRSTLAGQKREFRADGQMYFRSASASSPIKFRFEYFRPARQEIIFNGNILWVSQPDSRQVILSDMSGFFEPARFDPSRDRAVNFLQGLGRISRDFSILLNSPPMDVAGNFILELTPLRNNVTIRRLFLTVDRRAVLAEALEEPPPRIPGFPPQPMQRRSPDRRQPATPGGMYSGPQEPRPVLQVFPILSSTVVDPDGNSTTMEFSNAAVNRMIPDMMFNFIIPAGWRVVPPPAK